MFEISHIYTQILRLFLFNVTQILHYLPFNLVDSQNLFMSNFSFLSVWVKEKNMKITLHLSFGK